MISHQILYYLWMEKLLKEVLEIKSLNIFCIYFHNYRVLLVQDYIEDKSNEIPISL